MKLFNISSLRELCGVGYVANRDIANACEFFIMKLQPSSFH